MISFDASRRRRLILALVACLAAAAAGVVTTSAVAAPTGPTSIVIDHIEGNVVTPDLGVLPPGAQPAILVEANTTFNVDVSFPDSTGTAVPFNQDVTLAISGTTNSGAAAISPSTITVPKGNATFKLPIMLTKAANQVILTVSVKSGPNAKTVAPGVSYLPNATPVKDLRFDAVSDVRTPAGTTNFQEGIGGDTNCTNATSTAPVCAIVQLPQGAGANVLLSVGACDTVVGSTYAPCFQGSKGLGGAVVQTLFSQPAIPYTVTSPAVVVVKCDKTLCGTGAISNLTVRYSLQGNGDLSNKALPCPAKNTMASPGVPCVDYVQSKRDGSGDTHLYLLTDQDLRGGIG